ncbi:MAG: helix-turn-helix transcriptional regulator [Candidatus Dormibacteraeota bacterium]|nr:helix-turn-helix transcriptional regulator [Candidatus Dormibacteraeota bacterium]
MTAQSRAIDRIVRICTTATPDDRSLRVAILNEIRPVVAFDAYAWLLTDPQTEVGCSPLADVPCLPELPRLIMLKYLTPINRWTQMKGPVARLNESTGARLDRSLLWNSLLRRYGVTDVASAVFRSRQGCWGFLDLWRINAAERFTESDAGFLTSIAKPVTEALQRSRANTFKLTSPSVPGAGPAVLILSPELEVRAQTAETDEYLRLLIPPDQERQPIPAAAYNLGAQLLAVEAGVDEHPPWARVHLSDGVWLTLRAARLGVPERAGNADIAVTIEKSSPTERLDLFSRACALSAREGELLGHLIQGADTHLTAERMFVAENTVQDHLKSIFAKTATSNRRTLLARAVGQ